MLPDKGVQQSVLICIRNQNPKYMHSFQENKMSYLTLKMAAIAAMLDPKIKSMTSECSLHVNDTNVTHILRHFDFNFL